MLNPITQAELEGSIRDMKALCLTEDEVLEVCRRAVVTRCPGGMLGAAAALINLATEIKNGPVWGSDFP